MISKETTAEMNGQTITLPVPQPIYGSLNIESTPIGAIIQLDNKEVGKTPKSMNEILVGRHEIKLTKEGFKPYTEMVTIAKGERKQVKATLNSDGDTSLVVKPQQSATKSIDGVFFVMANAAYSLAPQASFGLTLGSVKKLGWYASLSSNFKFVKADYECDYEGNISGLSSEYSYSGQKSTSRLGATAGMVFRIYDPLYAYVGGGYGSRNVFWQLENGSWVKCTDDSYQGIAIDAGLMLHFKGFGFSLGVQTIGVKYLEAKIGVGYTLKRN
jgi:opacity protein-like surface antigen